MIYPQITDEEIQDKNFMNQGPIEKAMHYLQNMPHEIVTAVLAAGASGATTSDFVFVAPVKGEVLDVKFIMTKVQTGTGNTPVAKLVNGSADVAESAAIALSGAIGDVINVAVDADEAEFAAGDKLKFSIVNPAGTITVALEGKLQIIWKPKA